MIFPFLDPTPSPCPPRLLEQARSLGAAPRVALVSAGSTTALAGIREAAEAGLAEPILIGDLVAIQAAAEQIGWDIAGLRVVAAADDQTAATAAALAVAGEADSIMKGQIHTSTMLKGLLPSAAGLRAKGDVCAHMFHLTVDGNDRALILTDAALNAAPDVPTRQAALRHAVALSRMLGDDLPKVGILAPSEDITPGIPCTGEAAEIALWAKTALPGVIVEGPMALDLMLSAESARIKGFASQIAGDPDIILVPEITSGNAIVKLMILGMGACAGGIVMGAKVPILLTSRAQGAADRLASAALGAIVARGLQ
ncbi:MAG: Phosphate acetyltransferase [Pseudomonadota bacterium]|jgi:phosphate acetyltransferase